MGKPFFWKTKMIPFQEFKDSLGDEAEGLTEEQILKLRENQDQMADIFFDMWLRDMKNNDNLV